MNVNLADIQQEREVPEGKRCGGGGGTLARNLTPGAFLPARSLANRTERQQHEAGRSNYCLQLQL